jgi:hypothetical protein
VPANEIDETVRKFQQSKTFNCSKHGVINMAVGKVRVISTADRKVRGHQCSSVNGIRYKVER